MRLYNKINTHRSGVFEWDYELSKISFQRSIERMTGAKDRRSFIEWKVKRGGMSIDHLDDITDTLTAETINILQDVYGCSLLSIILQL